MLNKVFYFIFDFKKSKLRLFFTVLVTMILIILGLATKSVISDTIIIYEILLFPFVFISGVLKDIALSGSLGNGIALVLLAIISLSPIIIYLIIKRKRHEPIKIFDVIFFLAIATIICLTLYYLINPGLIDFPLVIPDAFIGDSEKFINYYRRIIILGVIFVGCMAILLYIVIRLILYIKARRLSLYSAANILLIFLKLFVLFVFVNAFYLLPFMIKSEFKALPKGDSRNFLFCLMLIRYVFSYVFTVIIFKILRNLHDLLISFKNKVLYSENNVVWLKGCSKLCMIYLIFALLQEMVINGYQLIFKTKILNVSFSFSFPIVPTILTVLFYLLSLVMAESYKIYADNSLTI